MQTLQLGEVQLAPQLENGFLISLGAPRAGSTPLRNASTRWLPWFDTFEGGVFSRFRFEGIEQRGDTRVLRTTALCDNDYPFRERRDCSGDLCFRNQNWDAPPLEAQFDICFEEAREEIDGRSFSGFKYWFEYSGDTPIHRIVDRQTWEIGGNLDDLTICLRNWLTPPRMKIEKQTEYSTVGLDEWSALLPGNLWARWSLLPSFDFQYGNSGVLLGFFNEVSLIRSVVESSAGENCLRVLDLHLFEQSTRAVTNAKTILFCPDVLDDVDALNLWTRVHDREHEKSARQLGIEAEAPPAIVFSHNVWRGFRFDTSYEEVVEVASEFGGDYVFIDPVWEHQQALKETLDELIPEAGRDGILKKFWQQNMCVTLDFEVAQIHGGEEELKALCERAAQKNVRILSWMAAHLSPNSALQDEKALGSGANTIFAARESGRHPDTGYAASCWTLNLDAPIGEKMKEQLLGVCERTGMAGFLWDSFSNLGWWQLDYSSGTLRPQWDKMAALYADLNRAGLYIQPEAIVGFSNHSCCGLHGGNIYAGDAAGYAYNTNISLWFGGEDHSSNFENRILRGEEPLDVLFECIAHKRVPGFNFHLAPRDEWNEHSATQIRELLGVYKAHRTSMQKRTVLKGGGGVLWQCEDGESKDSVALLFSFQDQPFAAEATDAATGVLAADGRLKKNRVYQIAGYDNRAL